MFFALLTAACGTTPTTALQGVSGPVPMPLVGIGTWLYNNSVAEQAVSMAFANGYRHVDTANMYENQEGVGKALKASGVPRSEFFVTSKIPGGLNTSASTEALEADLKLLGLEYVDLMLLHFPATMDAHLAGGPAMRKQQWLALEAFAKAGKAKAIGVSHYCPQHLEDVISVSTLPVALNQVEYHVGMGSAGALADDGRAFMDRIGVKFMSFSPLCGPCGAEKDTLITGDLVTTIGRKYGKTGAQVALKWLVQQDIPVIPKTSNIEHLKANLDLFSFTLSEEDMVALTTATKPAVTGAGDGKTSGDCPIQAMEAQTLFA